jgi:hypothetical protein
MLPCPRRQISLCCFFASLLSPTLLAGERLSLQAPATPTVAAAETRAPSPAMLAPVQPTAAVNPNSPVETVKQPVFLICPRKETYSSWSIFMLVDKRDPSKVVSLGLESLKNLNGKDTSYDEVLRAQSNEKLPREQLGALTAGEFGRREIVVAENDSLHLALTPGGINEYSLMINMRVGWSDRFVIGGKERGKKEIALKYNKAERQWMAYPRRLVDTDGADHSDEHAPMPGIVFPVASTGIYRVFGVLDSGETVQLLDR